MTDLMYLYVAQPLAWGLFLAPLGFVAFGTWRLAHDA